MTKIMLSTVTKNNCKDLWIWRNHPRVRKTFFNSKPILWEEHLEWFYSKIKDQYTKIYIATIGKDKIGVMRFEIMKNFVNTSVNLNPDFFDKHLGARLIEAATKKMFSQSKTSKPIIAEIKRDNIAAQKAFSKAGFKYLKTTNERVVYKKER